MIVKTILFIIILIFNISISNLAAQDKLLDRNVYKIFKNQNKPSAVIKALPYSDLTAENELDSFIIATMATNHIPGLSACIITGGHVTWSKGYGWANILKDIPVTDTTIFMLASISKTVTGVALMQLYDKGLFELDDNINDYLPFAITNPSFPEDIITFRQLLTHTASLRDNWDVMYYTYCDGDTPWPLHNYVEAYFQPGGMFYNASKNFYAFHSGTYWSYCNHNFVLAGYLVQAITGLPFEQYCRDSLFIPLGMNRTAWFLRDLDTNNVAMPYHYNGTYYEPLGLFGYADWPAGALRTSCLDLARHLLVFLQYGEYNGTRILDSTTVSLMTTQQCPMLEYSQGLVWFLSGYDGHLTWRHGGSDQGVSTLADFCPELNTGVIVLTNGESYTVPQTIVSKLYEYSSNFLDADSDGIEDYIDNCPEDYNPGQEDSNNDNIGDACCCAENRGNVDCSEENTPDISDITRLIDYLYITHKPLCCPPEADANGSGGQPDISDITSIIDYLYLTHQPLAVCP